MTWTKEQRQKLKDPAYILKRFLSKVNKNSGKFWNGSECWEWTDSIYKDGYGRFSIEKQRIPAHRYSYIQFVKPILNTDDIHHKCKNRSCVNPDHLECYDHAIHASIDSYNSQKTHCPQGHEYTENNINYSKLGQKSCKKCDKIKHQIKRIIKRQNNICAEEGCYKKVISINPKTNKPYYYCDICRVKRP